MNVLVGKSAFGRERPSAPDRFGRLPRWFRRRVNLGAVWTRLSSHSRVLPHLDKDPPVAAALAHAQLPSARVGEREVGARTPSQTGPVALGNEARPGSGGGVARSRFEIADCNLKHHEPRGRSLVTPPV